MAHLRTVTRPPASSNSPLGIPFVLLYSPAVPCSINLSPSVHNSIMLAPSTAFEMMAWSVDETTCAACSVRVTLVSWRVSQVEQITHGLVLVEDGGRHW